MPRVFLLVLVAALIGGFAASTLFGREDPSPQQTALSGGGDIRDVAIILPTPTAVTPCPACGQDEAAWRAQTAVPPPVLLGKSAALIEASCGRQVFGQQSHERRAPASLTKIATALVVADQNRMQEQVDIQLNGWDLSAEDDSSIMGLEAGMRMPVSELVWGLLLRSGNDAAVELARIFGGQARFVDLMNAKVKSLGLKDTQFKNPHGLDADGLYSTTFDMAVLGKTLLAHPTLAEMVRTKDHPTTWSSEAMPNGNWLLYVYPDSIGIKTGYTENAGATIVSAATRDGRTLVASVFDSADVFWDSMRLFDWAFANTRSSC
ncbi:MAG: D-alanyl-D-alanine carboxypeptidase family protein [Dehalococcoidia bacterium]